MSDHNIITIDTYNTTLDAYLEKTAPEVEGDIKIWIDTSLSVLPKTAQILEIGTGTGRDADYMESLGYQVQRSDYADSFIAYNQSKGKEIQKIDILALESEERYDLIFANAVLLHFKASEVETIVKKIKEILVPQGIFSFSMKSGEGVELEMQKLGKPRYFRYRSMEEIKILLELAGFIIVKMTKNQENWIHVIAQNYGVKYI